MSPVNRPAALALCLAAGFTTLIDQSVLNVAVPALRSSLGASSYELQWLLAGYSLAFGLALVPGGRLGDARGRRGLFVLGLALFTATSVVAGTAREAWVVAVARLVQGAGAGLVNPQVLGLIQDLFDRGPGRARALGRYQTVGGVAGIIGPLVGGVLIALLGPGLGWRASLLLNLPFGVLTVVLAWRWLPRRPASPAPVRLDLPGLGMLAALLLWVLLPLTVPVRIPPAGWVLVAAVLVVAFVAWERAYPNPVLDPVLLRSRGFISGTLVAMFQFGAGLATSLVLMLLMQGYGGASPVVAALTVLPSAAGYALCSAFSWRLVGRFGRRGTVWALAGALVASASAIACALWVPAGWLPLAFALTQLASGSASGLMMSPNQALTLHHAPDGAAGLAAGFLQVAQRIAAAVALAAVSGAYLAASAGGEREAAVRALSICACMVAASLLSALLDRAPRRTAHASP